MMRMATITAAIQPPALRLLSFTPRLGFGSIVMRFSEIVCLGQRSEPLAVRFFSIMRMRRVRSPAVANALFANEPLIKPYTQATIERERLGQRNRPRIAERVGDRLCHAVHFEERSVGVVALVEQVGDQPEYLHLLVDLIRSVQVGDPIGGYLRIL